MNSYEILRQYEIEADLMNEFIQQLIKNHALNIVDNLTFVLLVKEFMRKNKIETIISG